MALLAATEREEPDARSVPVDVWQLVCQRRLEQFHADSAKDLGDLSSMATVLIA
ncbi:MAG TPA: hypothetical protein VFP65_08875 [Anaeromyxobacteraceae bacterium]|nr:hypothetical protein [Anaeromyxobacteraceae bacterium]